MSIEPHTTEALLIAALLALQVMGLGLWGLVFTPGRRRGRRG